MQWIIIHHFTCLLLRIMRQARLRGLLACGLLTSALRSFFFASFFAPSRYSHPLLCFFKCAIGCGQSGCRRLLLCWLGVSVAFGAHQRWLCCLIHRRRACSCLSSDLRVWFSWVVSLRLTVEPFSLRFSLFFLLWAVPPPLLIMVLPPPLLLLPLPSLLWLSFWQAFSSSASASTARSLSTLALPPHHFPLRILKADWSWTWWSVLMAIHKT